jgi:acetyl esterase/lipase
MNSMRLWIILAGLVVTAAAQGVEPTTKPADKVYTILPMGDSITEGNGGFSVYRYPLWEKLHAAGYFIEYVGSKEMGSRIGPLKHEGYGGHRADFFAKNIEKFYTDNPADIVLLHSGHNYTVEDKPVATIIASTETIVTTVRKLNPNAKILVAQVITSGKLPKYSYIPELNEELAKLVKKLDPQQENVRLVNMADGFNYETDTVGDKVHPNQHGADKMAQKWFDELVKILPSPGQQEMPQLIDYKKTKTRELQLHVFKRADATARKRAAIVYFFGGGWTYGTPIQYYAECRQAAAAGMVAIAADYRISSIDKATPFDSLADAKSAMRWVRSHADELGIDPNRIAAAGGSAGGHLAAAVTCTTGCDDPADDVSVSPAANALVLTAPVIDNGPDGFGYDSVKDRYKEFSPLHAVQGKMPPTKIFVGELDTAAKPDAIKAFQQKLQGFGATCDVHIFPGLKHGLFAYREPPTPVCDTVRAETLDFLRSIGFISGSSRPK